MELCAVGDLVCGFDVNMTVQFPECEEAPFIPENVKDPDSKENHWLQVIVARRLMRSMASEFRLVDTQDGCEMGLRDFVSSIYETATFDLKDVTLHEDVPVPEEGTDEICNEEKGEEENAGC